MKALNLVKAISIIVAVAAAWASVVYFADLGEIGIVLGMLFGAPLGQWCALRYSCN